jgi:hypothetical protein
LENPIVRAASGEAVLLCHDITEAIHPVVRQQKKRKREGDRRQRERRE